MKIWRDGDESSATCPTCEGRTNVVFQRRTVELENPDIRVPDVLVAVCRECDTTAMIPHQSTPRLRAAIDRPKEVVNIRVPGHLLDILGLLADRWAPGARSSTAAVLRLLLHEFGNDPDFARRVKDHVDAPLAQGPADHELSVRVPSHILIALDDMAALVGIATRSEVFRAMLAAAKEDLLDERDLTLAEAMEKALTAVA